jgi:DNA-binding LacI/PurR family transcriptional regulator
MSRLQLTPGSDLSLAGQLRSGIALLIADGELRPGDPLPAVRTIARDLGVSVNTIRSAYARLETDGLVRTRHGAATIVVASTPGSLARRPSQIGANAVGVLIAGLDPFYLPLLAGIEEVAARHGLLVLLADTQDSSDRAATVIRRLIARGVGGLIAVSVGGMDGADESAADRPARWALPPIVYVDQPDRTGHSFVFDAERGAYLAARHLLDHGHERVAMLTAAMELANVSVLHAGFQRALSEAGRSRSDAAVIEVAAFDIDAGRSGLDRLLERSDRPTGVFAAGADLALGVLDQARHRGIRVPDDLAVVGYADIETARLVEPPLSMVSVPAREIGLQAMTTLRRLMDGADVTPERVVLDVDLIVRGSCGPH